jgi:hypothetical protein
MINLSIFVARIKKLVNGLATRKLSGAAREVLVKAICQAIPTYSMSCFRLSKKMCKKITSIIARFWWGGYEKKQKIHWKKWSDIAIPKSDGGMGFRDFQLFNQAMLAKQGWRLTTKPDSLCARVLRGKYYHGSDFMCAKKKRNSSHVWRAILYGRDALSKGLINVLVMVVQYVSLMILGYQLTVMVDHYVSLLRLKQQRLVN